MNTKSYKSFKAFYSSALQTLISLAQTFGERVLNAQRTRSKRTERVQSYLFATHSHGKWRTRLIGVLLDVGLCLISFSSVYILIKINESNIVQKMYRSEQILLSASSEFETRSVRSKTLLGLIDSSFLRRKKGRRSPIVRQSNQILRISTNDRNTLTEELQKKKSINSFIANVAGDICVDQMFNQCSLSRRVCRSINILFC